MPRQGNVIKLMTKRINWELQNMWIPVFHCVNIDFESAVG